MKIEIQFAPGDTVFKVRKSFDYNRVVDKKCTCGEYVVFKNVQTGNRYEVIERVIDHINVFINKDGVCTIEHMGDTDVGFLGRQLFKTRESAEAYIERQKEAKS